MEDHSQGIKERVARVKQHLGENKKVYLTGAGCLCIGVLLRPKVVNIVDVLNIKYKSPTTTTVVTVLERQACPDPIPVLDKLTGESYRSIRRAAKVTGTNAQQISEDLHGIAERFEQLPDSVFA